MSTQGVKPCVVPAVMRAGRISVRRLEIREDHNTFFIFGRRVLCGNEVLPASLGALCLGRYERITM